MKDSSRVWGWESNLHGLLIDCRFSNFDRQGNERAFGAAYEFASQPRTGLYLFGPPGRGKTHLGAAIVARSLTVLREAHLISVPDFFNELRDAIKYNNCYGDPLRKYQKTEVLALDDVGAEGEMTTWAEEKLWSLVDYRWRNGSSTVFTTNLSPERLNEKLGERTTSRIMGLCGGVVYQLAGRDHRLDVVSEQPAT